MKDKRCYAVGCDKKVDGICTAPCLCPSYRAMSDKIRLIQFIGEAFTDDVHFSKIEMAWGKNGDIIITLKAREYRYE